MSDVSRLSTRSVYRNRWMHVREDEVRRRDGSTGIFGVVDKADAAVIIPEAGGAVWMVEQYRYAIGRRSLEFPQGSWETATDVDPLQLASGELSEETGFTAGAMRPLGILWLSPGFCHQPAHVFLATDLAAGPHSREPTESDMTMRLVGRQELDRLVARGSIVDTTTVAAYGLLLADERSRT